MCTEAPPVDRETAARLNPLISSIWTEDTLHQLAGVVRDLGYYLSILNDVPEGHEPHFGNLYLLFGPIESALAYEATNPRLCGKNLAKQEVRHD